MLELTHRVQVKQEKGVLVPLQKQGFSRKLAFSRYPAGKRHLHEWFKCAQCSQKGFTNIFPWGLPHVNRISRAAFLKYDMYDIILVNKLHYRVNVTCRL